MLHQFLEVNHAELVKRCREKVARRTAPEPTLDEIEHGIPLFLSQLIETLRGERHAPGSGTSDVQAELASGATRHGGDLLRRGFRVDQVVHDYGDLCQAITELAMEQEAPIDTDEFQTLNRCLDDAIADAVTEFGLRRDDVISESHTRAMSERLGFLAHELRNHLNTAVLSFAAVKAGTVGVTGPTAAVLDRSLAGLRDLIDRTLADVRLGVGLPAQLELVALDRLIVEVQAASSLEAKAAGCRFTVLPVEAGLVLRVDRPMLFSAISNLLQNAFKFTRPEGHVSLRAYRAGERVLIEVADECGGLPQGKAEALFVAFEQHHEDRRGLGLGLSISRRAVEASGGVLRVRDLPGKGCVFTIDMPQASGMDAPPAHERRKEAARPAVLPEPPAGG
ncbi:MAG TPA: HAMP domain-containing sensor histidine kinase [Usitatibacter sp.]|nr:HAMP domain-containing sensor histidine kinase [Usitatibacter sp.]